MITLLCDRNKKLSLATDNNLIPLIDVQVDYKYKSQKKNVIVGLVNI